MQYDSRYANIRNTLIFVFVLNLLVAAAKGFYGYYTHSVSMLADGFHSLFDGTSNIIGLIGIYIASKPADPDHPYGHTKFETIASLGIGVLLSITAVQILIASYRRLFTGAEPDVTTLSFIIMAVTIVVNIIVTTYEHRKGKALSSELLVSDSLHTRSDVFVSLSVIGSLIAVRLGFPIVDVIVALIIAGVIGFMAISILKETSNVLCDASAIEYDEIRGVVLHIEGVRDSHAIRTRGRRSEIYLDLHVLVDPKLSIDQAHDISDEVEAEIRRCYPEITDVLVHVEPYKEQK